MPEPYASLAMYPFEQLRPSWERLWTTVGQLSPPLRVPLRWSGSVYHHWLDPACILSHSCGWPVVTRLAGAVRTVGAFRYDVPGAAQHRYRSVIVSRTAATLAERDLGTARLAANADDSLSGWISLCAVLGRHGAPQPEHVQWTGSHLDSARALAAGRADLASIDAVSWAHISRFFPDVTAALHVIGHGPLVPSTPIVVPAATDEATVAEIGAAFTEACRTSATGTARAELLIDDFHPTTDESYEELQGLEPTWNYGTIVR